MPETESDAASGAAIARQALDRAHRAALTANGAELRQSLQQAREALAASQPQLAETLATALKDLDSGALAELETLLETVRRAIAEA